MGIVLINDIGRVSLSAATVACQERGPVSKFHLGAKFRRQIEEANMMKRLSSLVILAAFFCAGPVLAAESPVGKWSTIDEKSGKVTSDVELYEQGGKLFGKITGLPEPNDAKGKPKICTPCTGADKDQPVVGLVIIKDLSLKGDRYKDGTLLDPDDGKIYKGEVWIEGGKVKVRGYIGFFFRTQTWVRGK